MPVNMKIEGNKVDKAEEEAFAIYHFTSTDTAGQTLITTPQAASFLATTRCFSTFIHRPETGT
jgi:hypothetical protein